ncbi:MAG: hypothetical protein V4516_07355 [Pseudomonadota bacterium]
MTDASHDGTRSVSLKLRLAFSQGLTLGPGKADLLERIGETGSISAACRAMSMSYKRAWTLVEEMNLSFATPVVEPVRGGAGGGGARLTETGTLVLIHFRQLEAATFAAGAEHIEALRRLIRTSDRSDMSGEK